MRRLALLLLLCVLSACEDEAIPPFGDLNTPVAVAVHAPSRQVLVASQDEDELRVFDWAREEFLAGPSVSFPLSVPTVRTPRLLAAGDRFVFVVSGADGSVGFVDTQVPSGAFGPRSVDDAEGRPLTLPTELSPTAAAALVTPYGYAEGGALGDHLLVAGLLPDASGSRLLALRPPFEGALPEPVDALDLPGVRPADIALEAGFSPLDGAADCRAYALADLGEAPGIWLGRVEVGADGALSIHEPTEKIEVRVEVTLPDGAREERLAPIRAVEFAPVRFDVQLPAAVRAEPCAPRAGRIFAALDRAYCAGAVACPNLVAIDLPSGELARDAVRGGPAIYETPAAPHDLLAVPGPLSVEDAHVDFLDSEGAPSIQTRAAGPIDSLLLVASSDGGITYVAGGLGTRLLGPTGDRRTASDPVFLLDGAEAVPGLDGPVIRTDRRGTILPRPLFPPEAEPRRESWSAGFEIPLPGLEGLGGPNALEGDRFTLAEGSDRRFDQPIGVRASEDVEAADRLVPLGPMAPDCEGFPIVAVEDEGRALRVRTDAPGFENPPACFEGNVSFAVLPPRSRPWTLAGSASGFVGRAPGAEASEIRFGSRLLFVFEPPEEAVERGATFEWSTRTGFTFFRMSRDSLLLPASMALVPRGSSWRVVVAYSGSDAISIFNPTAPPRESRALEIFR